MKYHKARDAETLKLLDEEKAKLPYFCNGFFLGISQTTTPLTRLAYARDLRLFFEFLTFDVDIFVEKKIKEIKLKDLALLEIFHIELYADYLSRYERDGQIICNGAHAKQRKLSCLRSFFAYYFKRGEIPVNIMPNIDLPKVLEKPIIRLENDEIERVLDTVGNENLLTKGQLRFKNATEQRDYTILMFFLSTGVRVSELVGLNVGNVDINNASFKITRKGGAESVLYMSEELCSIMQDYLAKCDTDENSPLFKSIQNKRISVRQVENIVKKYAKLAVPLKNITPHKLRSTYGTNLYRETGDIYVVADVLGHQDVNTTKKHYAAISEDIKKKAASKVKVRKKDKDNDDEG